jgi:hypothetical protein
MHARAIQQLAACVRFGVGGVAPFLAILGGHAGSPWLLPSRAPTALASTNHLEFIG